MSASTVTPDLFFRTRWAGRRALYAAGILLALMLGPFLLWPAFAKRIFTSDFLPHRYCYLEKTGLVWTHVISDSLIGLAYLVISITLGYLIYKARRDIPFHWMFLAFGVFIVACGGTHFVEVITIWIPIYVFSAVVKIFTAVASVLTAIFLPFTVPRILSLVQQAKISEQMSARLRAITESASDAIISTDARGNIIYFNRAAEQIFRYTSSEISG